MQEVKLAASIISPDNL